MPRLTLLLLLPALLLSSGCLSALKKSTPSTPEVVAPAVDIGGVVSATDDLLRGRFERVEQGVVAVGGAVTDVEREVGELRAEVARIPRQPQRVVQRVVEKAQNVVDHTPVLSSLEKRAAQQSEDLKRAREMLGGLKTMLQHYQTAAQAKQAGDDILAKHGPGGLGGVLAGLLLSIVTYFRGRETGRNGG